MTVISVSFVFVFLYRGVEVENWLSTDMINQLLKLAHYLPASLQRQDVGTGEPGVAEVICTQHIM